MPFHCCCVGQFPPLGGTSRASEPAVLALATVLEDGRATSGNASESNRTLTAYVAWFATFEAFPLIISTALPSTLAGGVDIHGSRTGCRTALSRHVTDWWARHSGSVAFAAALAAHLAPDQRVELLDDRLRGLTGDEGVDLRDDAVRPLI